MSNYVCVGALPSPFAPISSSAALKAVTFSPAQLQAGRNYMTSQWRQMGVAAMQAGDFQKPTATKQADGKVSVPIASFLTDWNRQAARALRPVMRALRNVPMPSFVDKRKLENRPLDFLIDLFDPVFDRFEAACNRTQRRHIPRGKVQWFGKTIDLRIEQPGDEKMDASTRGFMRKMRIIQSFILLFFNKPVELIGECLKEGVDIVGDVGKAVGDAVDKTLREAGNTVQKAAEETGKAVAGVFDWIKGATSLGGYGIGLGEPVTAASGTAASGATAVGGIAIEQVIQQIIEKIMQALAEKAPEIAANLAQTAAQKGIENAFAAPPTATEVAAVAPAASAAPAQVVVTTPGAASSTPSGLPSYAVPLGIAAVAALGIGYLALRK